MMQLINHYIYNILVRAWSCIRLMTLVLSVLWTRVSSFKYLVVIEWIYLLLLYFFLFVEFIVLVNTKKVTTVSNGITRWRNHVVPTDVTVSSFVSIVTLAGVASNGVGTFSVFTVVGAWSAFVDIYGWMLAIITIILLRRAKNCSN